MKARDVLFAASLMVLAAFAFTSGNAAACEGDLAAADGCYSADLADRADQVVFQDYEVSDPTCVCSADLEFALPPGPEDEACKAG